MKGGIFKKIFALILFLGLLIAKPASAAVMFLTSSSATGLSPGDSISVELRINSQDANINAGQATLSFPNDILNVASVSKEGSIFNFWLEEPYFSNDAGIVSFIGGSTSGYSGGSLKVLTIDFNVIGTGVAGLELSGGAITASDGFGTNVLENVQVITIISTEEGESPVPEAPVPTPSQEPSGSPEEVKEKPEETVFLPPEIPVPQPQQIERPVARARALPSVPKIEVPFYPNEEDWYNSSANFLVRWELPADINKVATAINKDPDFDPKQQEGLFDNKFFPAPEEGVNYVHILFRNSYGWGEVAHYRIALDTEPPSQFNITTEKGLITDFPSQKIFFEANDSGSGVDFYEITIDNEPPVEIKENSFKLPILKPDRHIIKVTARDMAGNGTESSIGINVLPIDSPNIIFLTKTVYTDEGGFIISGTGIPEAEVRLYLKSSAGQEIAAQIDPVDKSGNWTAQFDEPLKKGAYYIEAVSQDERGALSLPVISQKITVKTKPIATIFGIEITPFYFYLTIILILIIAFGIAFAFYSLWRRQLEKRVYIAKRQVSDEISAIEKELEKMIKKYKNGITKTEMREVKYALKKMKATIKKHKEYLLEEIEEIKE